MDSKNPTFYIKRFKNENPKMRLVSGVCAIGTSSGIPEDFKLNTYEIGDKSINKMLDIYLTNAITVVSAYKEDNGFGDFEENLEEIKKSFFEFLENKKED